ncbi:MAG: preprotein translocase subunit YajC [Ferrovibrio sp.]|uniref:preprotein translocase subunit YajC n=1 Tax=Ferrovibrio sp. TaxID=1917215 RepID=UPI00262173AC|nr:preprotein translocase subunit YajC [Ferrovibrio sp.]MCW0236480.1 preprotein translocase subunit YajC [Ferrovibrio sp.]
MLISEAYAQAGGGTTDMLTSLLPLVLIFVVFYFLLIRPQQKKMKDHKAMIEAVRRGDVVTTAGGIIGKIVKVQEDGIVQIEIADGVKVKVLKSTIGEVRSKGGDVDDDDKAEAKAG